VVVRAQKDPETLGLAGTVPVHAPGGGLRHIGSRSGATCRRLWERIPKAHRGGCCYSDLWEAYRKVIPTEQHVAVGKDSGETVHVERWNNTLRQRLGRFVRKSLSFSKSEDMHEVCLRLFLHSYNLALISYD
jgi:insertion element IS1 protein InsB